MDRLKLMETFVAVTMRGSLTAAAASEGIAPAVVSRRMDALEERLGVKLMVRTTRKITLTFEGSAYLEDCQRILRDVGDAEAAVSLGGVKAWGHLRITAPAGFGRRHVAPLLMQLLTDNPEINANLDLSDRTVDLVNEGVDCAVRIGDLVDSSLISVRLGEMRRVVVGSPDYLARHGVPPAPTSLGEFDCLALGQQGGWVFREAPESARTMSIKVSGSLDCNDGAVLHDWALAGRGLAWRSLWEVGEDLRAGRLVSVLDDWAAPPVGINAVFPQRRHLPLRVRLFIDLLKENYSRPDYWEGKAHPSHPPRAGR
ncbi:MAG: LysR family transcriptional regulator [Gammaproteobacteria bacterium]|nr:LysR family transcriptional regulator [Rhodocyclaceae bacterium]MBU3907636.1 LysR family transcriptional regulator [Gammaproteobacteria bacterium]MBU3990876.1 LysR family transcriptional regulator [Gammaproteobacteria bacterium]MBU4004282.1 LysR family transcriptional regulator [Gammaproteobacteria bacterium]MBU4019691.1 LysR family transcriptional regulator [Gammaproteobacteria bacterium]